MASVTPPTTSTHLHNNTNSTNNDNSVDFHSSTNITKRGEVNEKKLTRSASEQSLDSVLELKLGITSAASSPNRSKQDNNNRNNGNMVHGLPFTLPGGLSETSTSPCGTGSASASSASSEGEQDFSLCHFDEYQRSGKQSDALLSYNLVCYSFQFVKRLPMFRFAFKPISTYELLRRRRLQEGL